MIGYGDELMAAGHAASKYAENPRLGPVAILDLRHRVRWHDLWRDNPMVYRPEWGAIDRSTHPCVYNGKGCRPYIVYPFTPETGWNFSPTWKARDHRGTIYLRDDEEQVGADVKLTYPRYMLIEPTPVRGNKNRRWPHDRWVALSLAARAFGLPILQLDHDASDLMPDTITVPHRGFREACSVLRHATIFISTEGGLVHAAAAFNVPTVALYGGCVSVDTLGYPEHTNLVDRGPESPCGKYTPCDHCRACWDRLTVNHVLAAIDARLYAQHPPSEVVYGAA